MRHPDSALKAAIKESNPFKCLQHMHARTHACFAPAVAVHPEDARYAAFVGRECTVPGGGGRRVRVVADAYVDREFGTGALKITPGGCCTMSCVGEACKVVGWPWVGRGLRGRGLWDLRYGAGWGHDKARYLWAGLT